jgi:ABC-type phosphate transport system permease subunit
MLSLNIRVTLVVVIVMPLSFLVGFFITKYGRRRFA